MVSYTALVAAVATRVRRGGGRGMGSGLSRDLIAACRATIVGASLTLVAANSPAGDADGSRRYGPTLEAGETLTLAEHAMTIVATHPHSRHALKEPGNICLLATFFTSMTLRKVPSGVALEKDIVMYMIHGGNLGTYSTTQLLFSIKVLLRHMGAKVSQGCTAKAEHEWRYIQQWNGEGYAHAVVAAAVEVAGRLTTGPGGRGSSGLPPPPSAAKHGFQRRGGATTAAVVNDTPSRPAAARSDGDAAPMVMSQVLKFSAADVVTETELFMLFDTLLHATHRLVGGGNTDLRASPRDGARLNAALADVAPHALQLPLFRETLAMARCRPLAFGEWSMLLWYACAAPAAAAGVSDAAVASITALADASQDGIDVLADVTEQQRDKLRSDAIRLLSLEQHRQKATGGGDANFIDSALWVLLTALPRVLPVLMRGQAPPGENPYLQAAFALSPVYSTQFVFLMYRTYTTFLSAAHNRHHSMPALLSIADIQQLHLLSEAAIAAVEALGNQKTSSESDGTHFIAGTKFSIRGGIAVYLARLLVNHHGRQGRVDAVDRDMALAHAERLLRRGGDAGLVHFTDWGLLLDVLSTIFVGECCAESGAVAAELTPTAVRSVSLFKSACDTLADLLGSVGPTADPALYFVAHRQAITVRALRTLLRIWAFKFQRLLSENPGSHAAAAILSCGQSVRSLSNACVVIGSVDFAAPTAPTASKPSRPKLPGQGFAREDSTVAANVTASALQLIALLDQTASPEGFISGEADVVQSTGVAGCRAVDTATGPDAAGSLHVLPAKAIREATANALEQFVRKPSAELQAGDCVHAIELVHQLLNTGALGPQPLAVAASAIRNTCVPENLQRLSWRQRAVCLRRCLQLYLAVEPQFASLKGCRQIGQHCLAIPSRLCLEKYAPAHTTAEREADDEQQRQQCADLAWKLCVLAIERPLRKCNLEKYLVVMGRFTRRYQAPPPAAFMELPAEEQRPLLVTAEEALKEVIVGARLTGHAPAAPVGLASLDPVVADLVAYNQLLYHTCRGIVRFSRAIAREDREVRARKIKWYHELYFTFCFVLLRGLNAVAPSVWHLVVQQACAFPRIFGPSGNYTVLLQKTLDVSAREVLRFAEERGNNGEWATTAYRRSQQQQQQALEGGGGDDAAAGLRGVDTDEWLLGPFLLGRLLSVVSSLASVDARESLLRLSAQTTDALQDLAIEDGAHESREDRDALIFLLNSVNGLRAAGRRVKRA